MYELKNKWRNYMIERFLIDYNDKETLDGLGIDFKHFGKAKINALVSICGCFDLQRLTDPQKEQSKFPDMKMMATTFLP